MEAPRDGGFLYIEDVQPGSGGHRHTLLMATVDRTIAIPRVGIVGVLPTFRVIASMNPFDNVGTTGT